MSGTVHTWEFRARFRRDAFGWKSQPAITRIKQAVNEIRKVAKTDHALGAEGAVLFLERLAPALERIDSSSGAIGSAVYRAIDELVPVIATADVEVHVRQAWLERLWQAIQEDEMPYIESLGDRWGELCVHPHLASRWADEFLPFTRHVFSDEARPGEYFKGTAPCLSAMLAAGRHDELIALIAQSRWRMMLDYRIFAVRALAAIGRIEEAITELESGAGVNDSTERIAGFGEEILLAAGQTERAFLTYGFQANLTTTFLATYRALCRKYPMIEARKILVHCIERTPGEEGKWFAAARHAGFLDVALHLATEHRTEPKTLITAARDHAKAYPEFTVHVGLAALRNLDAGYSYDEPSPSEVLSAYDIVMTAAEAIGKSDEVTKVLRAWLGQLKAGGVVRTVLGRKLGM